MYRYSQSIPHPRVCKILLLIQGICILSCAAFVADCGSLLESKSRVGALWLRKPELEVTSDSFSSWKRRSILTSILLTSQNPQIGLAEESRALGDVDSLSDLPEVEDGCVRIFFCRHGQTENNRLRKVQGARVDPPINENGQQQACNLGKALSYVDPKPNLFFCSNLQRARLTAEIAAAEIDRQIKVQQLDSLAEVDFGPIAEGKPVALAKAGMQATYASWAMGNLDFRPQEGGESGREVSDISREWSVQQLFVLVSSHCDCRWQVMQRAIDSITTLTSVASKSANRSCVAVTHSTFLRILLALALDIPLLDAASMSVVNGGVSVIDVPLDLKTRRMGKNSKVFIGGNFRNIGLEVPICRVVRINETRHLPTVPIIA